jgi:hypothetical protein
VALVEHRFRPGEQLMIADLADHLRLSSTPVREARICLRAEALLDTSSRRGFFVKILTQKEMTELFGLSHLVIRTAIEKGIGSAEVGMSEDLHCEGWQAAPSSNGATDRKKWARFYAGALEIRSPSSTSKSRQRSYSSRGRMAVRLNPVRSASALATGARPPSR